MRAAPDEKKGMSPISAEHASARKRGWRQKWDLSPFSVLALGIVAAASQLAAQQKAPVPDAEAQQAVKRAAADIYGKRFREAKTAAAKTALAKEMLDAASKVRAGSADQYVLLSIARDIAAGAGDAPTALEAVDKLAEAFDVPGAKLKAETLLAAAREASSSTQRKAVAEAAVRLLDDLAGADEYETAIGLCEAARSAARKARQYALVRELTARAEHLKTREKAFQEYRKAVAVLNDKPGDPAANLAAGRYLCFERGDWARGVPMLALGSDADLQALAAKDLKGAGSAEEQAALGDAWWALAEKKEGQESESLKVHAGSWYQQAEPNLPAGLARVKVEKRLAELAKLGREIPEPPGGPPPAVAPFDAKKAKAFQVRWAKHLNVPVVQTNSIGMKLVLIPPGEFDMGSTKEQVERLLEEAKPQNAPAYYIERVRTELPKHRVKITRPFCLGMCEVTQGQYQRVMGRNPSKFQGDPNHPVEQVSWNEALEFCRKLTELPEEKAAGAGYRLPTEAEWEYACRAGTTSRYSFGDLPAGLAQFAWSAGNAQGRTHPVGRLRPNPWGLLDVHGNVWEWCHDWHAAHYYAVSRTGDPRGPDLGASRVLRGGSWLTGKSGNFRCAYRDHRAPGERYYDRGFRVTMTLGP